MPRLIVLNGPPGCGKSTLARRYVDDHLLALNLDIDRVRDMLGSWRDDPYEAGLRARAIVAAAARAHLASGHDVVVPQYLGRPEFLDELERLAVEAGACFHELVLLDTKENALRRFAERTRGDDPDPDHVDAQRMLDRTGGEGELAAMYDRLIAVIAQRPGATTVRTVHGEVDRAYRDILRTLE